MRNYYKVLEISESASPKEIKKAYYRLIKQWHPDHNPHTPISDDMMKMFNEAYNVLSSPQRRQAYDETIGIQQTSVDQHKDSFKTQNTENVSSYAPWDSHDCEVPQYAVKQPFAMQVAKASWIIPLLCLGIVVLGKLAIKSPKGSLILGDLAILLFVVGIFFGLTSLLGIKNYGRKGILLPGIIGIILNSVFLTLLVLIVISANTPAPSWETLNSKSGDLYEKGKYQDAVNVAVKALIVAENTYGPDHVNVAVCLNNLALLYDEQGKYAEAEPLYIRSLRITRKSLGPEHPDVATTLNNLAGLYDKQGKYFEAEENYRWALIITERALGPDHPRVTQSLNNLARLYSNQSKYEKAEPLYRRSLKITEKALGPDHPDVAILMENMAELYEDTGRIFEATECEERARVIWSKTK